MDLSVVITCYNRKDYLDYALASFAGQTYPMDRFEVIVVDDGSTDGTIPHIKSQRWPFTLKTVYLEKNQGISYARNRGIDEASGEIVVFSDSDIIVPPNYLERHWKAHQKGKKLVVSAPYRYHIYTMLYPEQLDTPLWRKMVKLAPELSKRIPEKFASDKRPIALLSTDEVRSGYADRVIPRSENKTMTKFMSLYPDLKKCPMPWLAYAGSNSSLPRKSLMKIGGFAEDLKKRHDDRDIGYRLYLTNHKFVLDKSIVATHQDHLLKHERKSVDYYRYHDLAIMLKKFPHRDLFLFGLYQTQKKDFKPLGLTHLKQQMMKIEKSGKDGKQDVSQLEKLLRYHVVHEINKTVTTAPLKKLEKKPDRKPSKYQDWLKKLKKYKQHREFLRAAEFLVKRLK